MASSKLMISLKHKYINGFLDRRMNFTKAVISESYFDPQFKDINKIFCMMKNYYLFFYACL